MLHGVHKPALARTHAHSLTIFVSSHVGVVGARKYSGSHVGVLVVGAHKYRTGESFDWRSAYMHSVLHGVDVTKVNAYLPPHPLSIIKHRVG